jgi:secretion/DNA translocation related TadE-like protein
MGAWLRPASGDADRGSGDRHARDAGAASLWVLAGCLLLGTVALLPVGMGQVGLARHRAAVAADLGALAGSRVVTLDQGAACRSAGRVAVANGARLLRCAAIACALVTPPPGAGGGGHTCLVGRRRRS